MCSSEQVRKATDAEWLGAELCRTLATELLNSRQRSGQRGYVDVEPEEETDVVNVVEPQAMETWLETRPRHPGSEPGSEPGERTVRPRVGSESNAHRMDGDAERQPSTATEGDVLQGAAGATTPRRRCNVSAPFGAPTINPSQTLSYPQTSTSQAIVHGSVDAVPEQDPTTLEASKCLAVFDNGTRSCWIAPKPKDNRGVVYDELSSEDEKEVDASRFKEIDNLLKLDALSVMTDNP